jgi:outer membrane receptor for ferrienterochelin and colicin
MLSNTASVSPTDTWKLSDANIVPQNGWQAAFGIYKNAFKNKVELSLEGYYKAMNNYLDYKSSAILNMNDNIERDVLSTEGKAYGIELMAKKPLGKLNGWMSYTYARTFLRESGQKEVYNINGGNWYPASYDKPHDFKIIANYKFTQRYSISLNVDYSTGRPVTIPISRYFYGDGYRLYYSERNAYRIPDYFRMDFAINIEPSHYLKFWTYSTITIGVYNLTGRKNAFSVYYDTNYGSSIKGYMLSIFGAPIPYINYNIKF